MRARLTEEWAIFLLAVQFLTRIPVSPDWSEARMSATPRWYPAVGLLIGGIAGFVFWGAAQVVPPLLAALLATAAGVILTGAFHEDGFADCCDGLGGAVSRERTLEIMRDSRLGTYGALGLGLLVAAKIAALASLPAALVPWLLVAGHAASRASSVLVIATSTYVRDHGTGKPIATGTDGLWLAWITGGLACLPLALAGDARLLLAGALGLILGHIAMRRVFEKRLGGYTGDCLGAVQQTSEAGVYLAVLAVL
ncbi:adenosylcobinamide-GDP ribazoletransferase [Ovoidimarina sediminis]|uniref:adenosylcobinamide-GDP ribazoletransferase n=1 Tax=Ovoidimarina sediminis TaxID=3079856 RepID=UPI002909176B|nr:adenosylcobinamide-GDP ribazoletransferase [Rhodophyticola sp. MJ-SS7]MDU8944391.1 adenosylcobinamide-GDP ribazoletransferase [Rhodophyticola sp. MJ-SS7]